MKRIILYIIILLFASSCSYNWSKYYGFDKGNWYLIKSTDNSSYEMISDIDTIKLIFKKWNKYYDGAGDYGKTEIELFNDTIRKDWTAFDLDADLSRINKFFKPVEYNIRTNLNKIELNRITDSLRNQTAIYFVYPPYGLYRNNDIIHDLKECIIWDNLIDEYNSYFQYDGFIKISFIIDTEHFGMNSNEQELLKNEIKKYFNKNDYFISFHSDYSLGKEREYHNYYYMMIVCNNDFLINNDINRLKEISSLKELKISDFEEIRFRVDYITKDNE